MRPRLPDAPSGSGYIDRISSNWFRDLLRCVDWAMKNPRGDGATILNKGDGIMSAVQPKQPVAVIEDTGYLGSFKVVDVPTSDGSAPTQIKIIDGADEEATECGLSDLGTVPVITAAKTADRHVWLTVTVDASLVPTFGVQLLSGAPTTSGMGYYRIAYIASDGAIEQIWQGGEIHFRSEFLI